MAGAYILELLEPVRPPVAVTLIRPAEFVVLPVGLRSGRKTFEEREAEIKQTIGRITEAVKAFPPLEATPGTSLRKVARASKFSSSGFGGASGIKVDLQVPITERTPDIAAGAAIMRRFLNSFDFGKVECFPECVTIEIGDPEQHRTEVLKAIHDDCRRNREIFGPTSRFVLTGLAQTVKTVAVDASNLALYIDYSLSVETN